MDQDETRMIVALGRFIIYIYVYVYVYARKCHSRDALELLIKIALCSGVNTYSCPNNMRYQITTSQIALISLSIMFTALYDDST